MSVGAAQPPTTTSTLCQAVFAHRFHLLLPVSLTLDARDGAQVIAVVEFDPHPLLGDLSHHISISRVGAASGDTGLREPEGGNVSVPPGYLISC